MRRLAWRFCVAGAVVLVAVALSPWTLSPDTATPMLAGLPRALWVGFAVAAGLLLVAMLGAAVRDDDESDSETR